MGVLPLNQFAGALHSIFEAYFHISPTDNACRRDFHLVFRTASLAYLDSDSSAMMADEGRVHQSHQMASQAALANDLTGTELRSLRHQLS
jgi:hypothetical protein